MPPPTLVIDNHIPFIKGVLEPYARVIYASGGVIDHNLAAQADGLIIRTRTRCDALLLEGTPVRFIATATIGYDHIDTGYCSVKGISWYHAPGCNAASVCQYIASALANLSPRHGYSLPGKKIGVVGVGNVGSRIARLAEFLGMVPLLNDPPRERAEGPGSFIPLEQIMETCDIITFHVPLHMEGIDRTFHLADRDFFQKLKKKPWIINTSRGAVVETVSVKEALRNGLISGFMADVWENEPLLDLELMEMTEIATPHIAGYSVEGKANGTSACVSAAGKFFGFGLENWHPPLLPSPANPLIVIDPESKTEEQVIAEAILASYDVNDDDRRFRDDPSRFEELRNNYPIRREFEAFTIHTGNLSPGILNKLIALGFNFTA